MQSRACCKDAKICKAATVSDEENFSKKSWDPIKKWSMEDIGAFGVWSSFTPSLEGERVFISLGLMGHPGIFWFPIAFSNIQY